jgi:hypothetical protein
MQTELPMQSEFPLISATLVNKLNEIVPERCPSPDDHLPAIYHYAGKRAMVNFLIEIHEDQMNSSGN